MVQVKVQLALAKGKNLLSVKECIAKKMLKKYRKANIKNNNLLQ